MFVVDLKYLKKVGLYYDEEKDFMRVRKNSFRYPTLSCKLVESRDSNNFVFVLSYFVSDDFAKQQIEFTLEDWQQFGKDMKKFEKLRKNGFFQFFSITNTLVMNVYKSRLKSRKAWKKRSWALPFRNAQVRETFGVGERRMDEKTSETCSFAHSFDYVKAVEEIVELDRLMKLCVVKASQDFSYAPFDVYFDCYKKKLKLQKKMSEKTSETCSFARINRDKVFKEFAKQVVLLQKNG